MYYQPNPQYFCKEEFFSPTVVEKEDPDQIWRLMDWRILYTIDEMRIYFNKPIRINNWKWVKDSKYRFEQRGFRAFEDLAEKSIDMVDWGKIVPSFSSFTSQHCFGRALDFDVEGMFAEEVREDIQSNHSHATRYQYITTIEGKVNWVHMDVRCWNVNSSGILII
jgi:hypothetical protein